MSDTHDAGIRGTGLWQAGRSVKESLQRSFFEQITKRLILPKPFRLVVIAGQKRSGNHVFINWFLSQSHGPCSFFNLSLIHI